MAAALSHVHGKVLIQVGEQEPIEVGTVNIPVQPVLTIQPHPDLDPEKVAEAVSRELARYARTR